MTDPIYISSLFHKRYVIVFALFQDALLSTLRYPYGHPRTHTSRGRRAEVQYISLNGGRGGTVAVVAGAAHDGQSSVSSDAVGFIVAAAPPGGSIPPFKSKSRLPVDDISDEDVVESTWTLQ